MNLFPMVQRLKCDFRDQVRSLELCFDENELERSVSAALTVSRQIQPNRHALLTDICTWVYDGLCCFEA